MTRAGELFTYDAQFEDMALRTHIRGQAAITRYLQRALPDLPYPRGIHPARRRRRSGRRIRMALSRPGSPPRRGSARAQQGRQDH